MASREITISYLVFFFFIPLLSAFFLESFLAGCASLLTVSEITIPVTRVLAKAPTAISSNYVPQNYVCYQPGARAFMGSSSFLFNELPSCRPCCRVVDVGVAVVDVDVVTSWV